MKSNSIELLCEKSLAAWKATRARGFLQITCVCDVFLHPSNLEFTDKETPSEILIARYLVGIYNGNLPIFVL